MRAGKGVTKMRYHSGSENVLYYNELPGTQRHAFRVLNVLEV